MSARYTQAEAALAELRAQALSGQGAEASVRQLSEELTATQALVRARESELAETRHTIERARAEITMPLLLRFLRLDKRWPGLCHMP